ncbi:MAG: MlaA family lipoprotein, partial [Pseudomonadota bacterium]
MISVSGFLKSLTVIALSAGLGACSAKSPEQRASNEIFDPNESTNRSIHAFNRGVDRVFFRPASKGYVRIVPPPMVTSFSNFAENLSYPGQTVNYLLQGNPEEAGITLGRFLLNSTFGLA